MIGWCLKQQIMHIIWMSILTVLHLHAVTQIRSNALELFVTYRIKRTFFSCLRTAPTQALRHIVNCHKVFCYVFDSEVLWLKKGAVMRPYMKPKLPYMALKCSKLVLFWVDIYRVFFNVLFSKPLPFHRTRRHSRLNFLSEFNSAQSSFLALLGSLGAKKLFYIEVEQQRWNLLISTD